MTGMLSLLSDVKPFNGGPVAFTGDKGGRITSQGVLTNGCVSFDRVNYVAELENNLLSISQISDKGYSAVFNNQECIILKPGYVVPIEWVLMRAPRERDLYVLDMSTASTMNRTEQCFVSKATEKESILWHRKMGHLHVRKMNQLVTHNLVEGVNSKGFHLNDDCVACKKGKQTKKSHPTKLFNSINVPLERLHMDLFGSVNVRSIANDSYCLVVTDDYSRFSWVMFLYTKDETSECVRTLILKVESLYKLKVWRIRSDNGTEFKNNKMYEFCTDKGIL